MTRPRNPTRKKNHHSAAATQRTALWQRLLAQVGSGLRAIGLNPAHYHGNAPWSEPINDTEKDAAWQKKHYDQAHAALDLITPAKKEE